MCVESYKYWIQIVNSNKFSPHPSRNVCGESKKRVWWRKKSFVIAIYYSKSMNRFSQLRINKTSLEMDCGKLLALIRKLFGDELTRGEKSFNANLSKAASLKSRREVFFRSSSITAIWENFYVVGDARELTNHFSWSLKRLLVELLMRMSENTSISLVKIWRNIIIDRGNLLPFSEGLWTAL